MPFQLPQYPGYCDTYNPKAWIGQVWWSPYGSQGPGPMEEVVPTSPPRAHAGWEGVSKPQRTLRTPRMIMETRLFYFSSKWLVIAHLQKQNSLEES